QSNDLDITTDFPGGNIILEKVERDTVWLKPDLRDSNLKWFYWYFKITGIQDRTIHFRFSVPYDIFTRFGPAYSINNNQAWKWYGEYSYDNQEFIYPFSKEDTVAYFSVCFPYTQKDLNAFLSNVRNKRLIKSDTLCFSRAGRAVEELSIKPSEEVKY